MKASKLTYKQDYPDFPEFAEYGIPLNHIKADLITTLQSIRTETGIPIYPGPLKSEWARFDGSKTSRHYAVDRLSDAGDIFPVRSRVLELWVRLQAIPNIGAIGLYADTDGPDGLPWPMVHFDLRNARQKVLWARDGEYFYLPQDRIEFWRIVAKITELTKYEAHADYKAWEKGINGVK